MQDFILMPDLESPDGDARIARWYVSEGQLVDAGEVLAEIETPSLTIELEAKRAGRIAKILVPAGASAIAGATPIALILADGAVHAPRPASAPLGFLSSLPDVPRVSSSALDLAADQDRDADPAPQATVRRTIKQALRDALASEMRADPAVVLIGVDVANNRGAPKVTQGLIDEFGAGRVVTVPPLESAFTGMAIGAAMAGLRPVVEFTSWSAALEVLPLVLGSAATLATLSGGTVSVPLVLRAPNGWSPGLPGASGRCVASLLAQQPGLKVVFPASPQDARDLLQAAIRDRGPVAVLEHEQLYDLEGEVAETAVSPRIGTARLARPGSDVTIATYGRMVVEVLSAAERLAAEGISAAVVDLRSLRPLDIAEVAASVRATGRLLTVEEGSAMGSIGSELAAGVPRIVGSKLRAPPLRIAAIDAVLPYPEAVARAGLPDVDGIVAAARQLCREA